jgi:hypothetical protein
MNWKYDEIKGCIVVEGQCHVDEWHNGVHHSWNIPNSFKPDLTFEERLSKWKAAHPEYDNFNDMDYAKELFKKFIDPGNNGLEYSKIDPETPII